MVQDHALEPRSCRGVEIRKITGGQREGGRQAHHGSLLLPCVKGRAVERHLLRQCSVGVGVAVDVL